jgi:surfeit locus 1 family protein
LQSTSSTTAAPSTQRRRFRPKWWAALLAIVFAAITIRLGNWQGERAAYKQSQQAQLEAAVNGAPISPQQLFSANEPGTTLRYRKISLSGSFADAAPFFVDNRIHDGKAGYALLQVLRSSVDGAAPRNVLVDRGWVLAPAEHAKLPQVQTPVGEIRIDAQVNLPPSRNPGTVTNANVGNRLNYVQIDELSKQMGLKLEPYILEQIGGPGFTGAARAAPGANFEKNIAYQVQWYAFAALAVIIFFVLSFRKQDAT